MKYSHIIWDFNGTLLNDTETCVNVMNKTLEKRNMPLISVEEYRKLFCFPVIDYYKKLGFTFENEPFEKVGMEFINNYEQEAPSCKLNKGVKAALSTVKNAGLSQSVLSAYHMDSLNNFIKSLQIADFFDSIIGLDNHYAESKTHLGIHWINETKINPASVLMIGDTTHDKEVADAMGIDIVLYPHGHQDRNILLKSGAKILDNLEQIADIIKK